MQRPTIFMSLHLILGSVLCVATSNNTSEIDDIRTRYIGLEKSLWNLVGNDSITKIGHLIKILNIHDEFINNYLTVDFDDQIIFQFNQKNSEWINLKKDLLEIDRIFTYFRTVLSKYRIGEYDENVAVDFAETLMNNIKLSTVYLFENIENVMLKIISYYRGMLNGQDQISVTKQSCQQFLFSVYSNITLTELKGYAMMQFSFMILNINRKDDYTDRSRGIRIREIYEKSTEKTQMLLRSILLDADRIVWRPDPVVHIKNVTYDKLTQFLQGYIENEVDLNVDRTCSLTCGDREHQQTKNSGCYQDLFCTHNRKCNGEIHNCQYIAPKLEVCLSSPKSNRRYDYIETGHGRILGVKENCKRKKQANSWIRGIYKCSYCLCFCVDSRSDRYFNLRETNSDVTANMVVTGLRFVKHNNIFHIQIQEGKLLPKGKINLETVHWKRVDDYHYFDSSVKSGIDYHTLDWNNRTIDFDTIKFRDPSYIVTGIRLRLIGTHLNLQVKFSQYDFQTGKLIDPKFDFLWIFNENTENTPNDGARKKIILQNPDIPIKSIIPSRRISNHNEYIGFTHSDISKDAAQNAVPFIDIQDVISNPPVPLSGCGIYFKGRDKFGGFIAPNLITHDFISHIDWPVNN